ncbi:nuclear transport factor 2 family protein [Mesorhizobium sp. B2-4-19]|uniref:nuclear transport factor 2 family protein n=1 Tax=Mesorhizobium sp. B2-4-19 TaxID=2589930 RepID=UPI001127BAC6|nr:nuclear transport factor 2 family protein [Mesorhizobium sp. B2-4-19]TPK65610.1 nuclear transport factor 2 family protein [Mesorhizobium sp. B2-4-19]
MIIAEIPYKSPSIADDQTKRALHELIARTLDAMSTPGSDASSYFSNPDIAVAGSGMDEFVFGPEEVRGLAELVSSWAMRWEPKMVVCWRRGDIAWAQIRIGVRKVENGAEVVVNYVATGVFALEQDAWSWLYWGGGEPQMQARV